MKRIKLKSPTPVLSRIIMNAGCRWPIIPAIQDAEIRRIVVRSYLGQTVLDTLSQK
jgi:hypothetical protein